MALKLRALSGPLKGKEFPLKAGLRIGRTKGDVVLDDGKVSSLHAFLTEENGELILNDNGSKNGIRQGNQRVTALALKAGVTFQIGKSDFEVAAGEASEDLPKTATKIPAAGPSEATVASVAAPQVPSPKKKEAPVPPEADPSAEGSAVNIKPGARRWNDILAEIATDAVANIKDQPKAVVALTPAVKLTFIGGVQAETRWVLGYGPRRAGAASIDLPIFESGAPEVCFEIIPSPEGVTFRTNHPKEVTLNGEQIRIRSLQEGDLITVGQTRIEVEFVR